MVDAYTGRGDMAMGDHECNKDNKGVFFNVSWVDRYGNLTQFRVNHWAATRVICDRNVPLKLKGKFYRVAIRLAMMYGSECWPITKALANRMEVAELRMLRRTCGKTILDMIPNGVYTAELEVETIINKMREGRLRWFGHVRRIPQSGTSYES
ncbi:hypothetical protein Tco_0169006 [Tanacetum coccineum]